MMEAPLRALPRYPGGKARLARWVRRLFGAHGIYVEPFGGSAAVLLAKRRCRHEVFNDLDGEVVHFFRVLQDERLGEKLRQRLEVTPYAREEFDLAYTSSKDPIERARRLVIRSAMGFGSNGLDTRYKASFRRPRMGKNEFESYAVDWVNFTDALDQVRERLRGVDIENCDAFELIDDCDGPKTLFFIDPPYVGDTRFKHTLTDKQHERLLDQLLSLRGMVALSGYDSEIYSARLDGWSKVKHASSTATHQPRTEIVWVNPKLAARRLRKFA